MAAVQPPASDVWSLLHALPIQYRQVLTLFYAEERSYEEIARALDMPLGTVKTHIHRGTQNARQLYARVRLKADTTQEARSEGVRGVRGSAHRLRRARGRGAGRR